MLLPRARVQFLTLLSLKYFYNQGSLRGRNLDSEVQGTVFNHTELVYGRLITQKDKW